MIVWGRRSSESSCSDAGLCAQGEDGTVCGIVDRGGCIGPTRGFRSVAAVAYPLLSWSNRLPRRPGLFVEACRPGPGWRTCGCVGLLWGSRCRQLRAMIEPPALLGCSHGVARPPFGHRAQASTAAHPTAPLLCCHGGNALSFAIGRPFARRSSATLLLVGWLLHMNG